MIEPNTAKEWGQQFLNWIDRFRTNVIHVFGGQTIQGDLTVENDLSVSNINLNGYITEYAGSTSLTDGHVLNWVAANNRFEAAAPSGVNIVDLSSSTFLNVSASRISAFTNHVSVPDDDWFYWGTGTTRINGRSSTNTIFLECASNTVIEINNQSTEFFGDIYLASPTVPSSASDTGAQGQIAWDSNYIYICTATNTWKRVAISAW